MVNIKKSNKKWLFHPFNQMMNSVVIALLGSGLGRYIGAFSAYESIISFVVLFSLVYVKATLVYPATKYPKYRSVRFANRIEELIVASKNAGLKLGKVRGNVFSFQVKNAWFGTWVVEILDNGDSCQVIAIDNTIECLKENILID